LRKTTEYASPFQNEYRNAVHRHLHDRPRTSLCLGCGRTLPEIARWHRMESAERQAVMAELAPRMADAGLVPPAARPKTG